MEDDPVFRDVISLVLDGCPSTAITGDYFSKVAGHIRVCDPRTYQLLTDLVTQLRTSYRSSAEFSRCIDHIPVTKTPDARVASMLATDCVVCLKPLLGSARIVRVRAASRDPTLCGHFFHHECFKKLQRHDSARRCPVCREAWVVTGPAPESDPDSLHPFRSALGVRVRDNPVFLEDIFRGGVLDAVAALGEGVAFWGDHENAVPQH